MEFELYGTSACHLCELAEAVLAELLVDETAWQIELIDIADDDDTLARYALKIPVLRSVEDGRELQWPFDASSVREFAAGGG
ncbi:glutaredoxin family protein [Zhongshania marina]|uniref:Thioredoxin family protein n=1 Tax=Zhongshania marina TaxID=2304603 RepID=A0A2S4HH56_9GAMM|nr:glutaredoxin family protein [Marortus luteolus]POP53031.1 thioredoxin family protein [Marortus luteolus]